mgnify:CR=1 FL=1
MTEQASKLMKEHYDFKDLVALMELLRSEEGCPWDRVQTHESIRKNLIEECYEAIEGIDRKDDELLCEELGDILCLFFKGFFNLWITDRSMFKSWFSMHRLLRMRERSPWKG